MQLGKRKHNAPTTVWQDVQKFGRIKSSYMFGDDCGKIFTFETLTSKRDIYACLETKIGKIITFKSLFSFNCAHLFYKIA